MYKFLTCFKRRDRGGVTLRRNIPFHVPSPWVIYNYLSLESCTEKRQINRIIQSLIVDVTSETTSKQRAPTCDKLQISGLFEGGIRFGHLKNFSRVYTLQGLLPSCISPEKGSDMWFIIFFWFWSFLKF